MPAPNNTFKSRMLGGETLYGCWLGLCSPYTSELAGYCGFDWLLIDGEHAPNDTMLIAEQLAVLERMKPEVVVRLPAGDDWMIKRALDAGAQNLLIPLVENGEQAAHLVSATRYAPTGHRGMGAALARASHFGDIPDYTKTANDEICLFVQVETVKGVNALDDILAVEGVDGVFIGPADLSADMGFPGNAGAPEVQECIADMLRRIDKAGKVPGILAPNDDDVPRHKENGARFIGIGIDVTLFMSAMKAKAAKWCVR